AAVAGAGFYSHVVASVSLDGGFVRWFGTQAYLVGLETGVVIVPGAVAALASPRDRRERVFAFFVVATAVLLLAEATVIAKDAGRYKERYVSLLLPLVPIAF